MSITGSLQTFTAGHPTCTIMHARMQTAAAFSLFVLQSVQHHGTLYTTHLEFWGKNEVRVPSVYWSIFDVSRHLCRVVQRDWGLISSAQGLGVSYPVIGARGDGSALLAYSYSGGGNLPNGLGPAFAGAAGMPCAGAARHCCCCCCRLHWCLHVRAAHQSMCRVCLQVWRRPSLAAAQSPPLTLSSGAQTPSFTETTRSLAGATFLLLRLSAARPARTCGLRCHGRPFSLESRRLDRRHGSRGSAHSVCRSGSNNQCTGLFSARPRPIGSAGSDGVGGQGWREWVAELMRRRNDAIKKLIYCVGVP